MDLCGEEEINFLFLYSVFLFYTCSASVFIEMFGVGVTDQKADREIRNGNKCKDEVRT
jgi:hypothetical protein